MKVTEAVAAGLLTLCLFGCDQMNSSNNSGNSGNSQGRTGSMGVTSQGIDDLAAPVSSQKDSKSAGDGVTP